MASPGAIPTLTLAFDLEATQVAYGYLPEMGEGQIHVVDLDAGNLLGALELEEVARDFSDAWIPVVRDFRSTVIRFALVRYGIEGQRDYPAFRWNTVSGDILPDDPIAFPFPDNATSCSENLRVVYPVPGGCIGLDEQNALIYWGIPPIQGAQQVIWQAEPGAQIVYVELLETE